MQGCKPIDTPIEKSDTLSLDMCLKTQEEKEKMAQVPYSSAIGNLMYAMMCTRPNIFYVVGLVSRFHSNPGLAHWKAILYMIR